MAWCEECARLVDDEDLREGACPRCGTVLDEPAPTGRRRYPWTFRFMIFASVIYLGYRTYQGVTWVVHHI